MSKSKINITKLTEHLDKVLNLLDKIDLDNLDNIKEINKSATKLQKENEKYLKNLDSKK